MKVIAINGSPRKNGNVARCLEIMAQEFEKEGIEVAAKLARNIAWTVKVINAAKGTIDPPKTHKRTFTNFIR